LPIYATGGVPTIHDGNRVLCLALEMETWGDKESTWDNSVWIDGIGWVRGTFAVRTTVNHNIVTVRKDDPKIDYRHICLQLLPSFPKHIFFHFFGSYTVHYRIYKDRPTNALSCMFLYFFHSYLLYVLLYSDLPPNTLNLEVTQQEPSRSLRMALSCRNI
jgi:hypothetical protein